MATAKFSPAQASRIGQVVQAYEGGRLDLHKQGQPVPVNERIPSYVVQVTEEGGIAGASDTTATSGTANLYAIDDDGTITDQEVEVEVWNVSACPIGEGSTISVVRDQFTGKLVSALRAGTVFGQLDGTCTAGGTATLSLHDGSGDTGENVTVNNFLSSSVSAGKKVFASWVDLAGGWYLHSGDC